MFLLLAACGGRQPAASSPAPTCEVSVTADWVRAAARDPSRFACAIDPARGLTSIELSSCEREPAIEASRQLCAADAGAFQADLARAVAHEVDDGPRIACTASQCIVRPSSEPDGAHVGARTPPELRRRSATTLLRGARADVTRLRARDARVAARTALHARRPGRRRRGLTSRGVDRDSSVDDGRLIELNRRGVERAARGDCEQEQDPHRIS